jgi:hypothetical protein
MPTTGVIMNSGPESWYPGSGGTNAEAPGFGKFNPSQISYCASEETAAPGSPRTMWLARIPWFAIRALLFFMIRDSRVQAKSFCGLRFGLDGVGAEVGALVRRNLAFCLVFRFQNQ